MLYPVFLYLEKICCLCAVRVVIEWVVLRCLMKYRQTHLGNGHDAQDEELGKVT